MTIFAQENKCLNIDSKETCTKSSGRSRSGVWEGAVK